MTTPPVMLLLMPYLVVRLGFVVRHRDYDAQRAAAIGLTLFCGFCRHRTFH